jgi:hypothetical protein
MAYGGVVKPLNTRMTQKLLWLQFTANEAQFVKILSHLLCVSCISWLKQK